MKQTGTIDINGKSRVRLPFTAVIMWTVLVFFAGVAATIYVLAALDIFDVIGRLESIERAVTK